MMNSSDLRYLMSLPKFDYFEPKTIDEACSLLSKHKDEARIIAGGTDLLIELRKREISPKYIINIKKIPNLDYVSYNKEGLAIGAVATLSDIENSGVVKKNFPLVAQAAHETGPLPIRNTGTMGGNLCNAMPSADTAPSLIGLEAKVKIQGPKGTRFTTVADFFVDSGKSALQNGEMLVEIQIPSLPLNTTGVFLKIPERSAMDVAVASVAAVITMDEAHSNIVEAKIVLGAVAPTPMRAHQAEDIVKGKAVSEDLIEKAALAAAKEAKPRTRPDYKRELVRVLTNRAIREAVAVFLPDALGGG